MVVSSRLRERDRLAPGVEQGEAAGAVGRLHHAGREAALPDGGRLLVAGDAEDADRPAEQVRHGRAEVGGAVAHLAAAARRGTPKSSQQLVVPVAAAMSKAACARRWWRRWHAPCRRSAATAGSCRRCRRQAGPARRGARAVDVVEQPGDLGRRRNRDRAAARSWPRSSRSWPSARSLRAQLGGAAVLPDDGVVDRLAGARSQMTSVSRWLVMPMRGDVGARVDAGLGHRRAHGRDDARPDLLRVVLDPAGRRKCWANSCCAMATGASAASNTIARVEVVPWSIARRCPTAVIRPHRPGISRDSLRHASSAPAGEYVFNELREILKFLPANFVAAKSIWRAVTLAEGQGRARSSKRRSRGRGRRRCRRWRRRRRCGCWRCGCWRRGRRRRVVSLTVPLSGPVTGACRIPYRMASSASMTIAPSNNGRLRLPMPGPGKREPRC